MAPLFYFLASSLNVELVYIILKSITQFHKCQWHGRTTAQVSTLKILSGENEPNLTIELNKIKIKNPSVWSKTSHLDFKDNNRISKHLKLNDDDMLVMH